MGNCRSIHPMCYAAAMKAFVEAIAIGTLDKAGPFLALLMTITAFPFPVGLPPTWLPMRPKPIGRYHGV